MIIGGQAPYVIVVRHYQQGKNTNGGMFNGMQSAQQVIMTGIAFVLDRLRNLKPQSLGLKNLRRKRQRNSIYDLFCFNIPPLIFRYLICYFNFTDIIFCI